MLHTLHRRRWATPRAHWQGRTGLQSSLRYIVIFQYVYHRAQICHALWLSIHQKSSKSLMSTVADPRGALKARAPPYLGDDFYTKNVGRFFFKIVKFENSFFKWSKSGEFSECGGGGGVNGHSKKSAKQNQTALTTV